MLRIRTLTRATIVSAVAIAGIVTVTTPAQAATIPVACSENALIAAVNLANTTVAFDTLVLAGGCTYTLTAAHGGPANGLPVITTPMEMMGPAVITRGSALLFRIAEVSSTGTLTLSTSVAFTNGSVIGDGGAILNHGAVTLTVSSLSGSLATGNGGGLANADTPTGTAPAATFTRSPVSNNTALLAGGGIYNGLRSSLTVTGVSGSPLIISGNIAAQGGGIAAVDAITSLTQTAVTANTALLTAGGVYRTNGTMTTTSSPITANIPNNCLGSAPAVPNCTS